MPAGEADPLEEQPSIPRRSRAKPPYASVSPDVRDLGAGRERPGRRAEPRGDPAGQSAVSRLGLVDCRAAARKRRAAGRGAAASRRPTRDREPGPRRDRPHQAWREAFHHRDRSSRPIAVSLGSGQQRTTAFPTLGAKGEGRSHSAMPHRNPQGWRHRRRGPAAKKVGATGEAARGAEVSVWC